MASSFFRFGYIRFWRNGGGNLSAHRPSHGEEDHPRSTRFPGTPQHFPWDRGFPHEESPRVLTPASATGTRSRWPRRGSWYGSWRNASIRPQRPLPDDPAPQDASAQAHSRGNRPRTSRTPCNARSAYSAQLRPAPEQARGEAARCMHPLQCPQCIQRAASSRACSGV